MWQQPPIYVKKHVTTQVQLQTPQDGDWVRERERKRERERGTENETERETDTHTRTHTHTQRIHMCVLAPTFRRPPNAAARKGFERIQPVSVRRLIRDVD